MTIHPGYKTNTVNKTITRNCTLIAPFCVDDGGTHDITPSLHYNHPLSLANTVTNASTH